MSSKVEENWDGEEKSPYKWPVIKGLSFFFLLLAIPPYLPAGNFPDADGLAPVCKLAGDK